MRPIVIGPVVNASDAGLLAASAAEGISKDADETRLTPLLAEAI